MSCELDEAKRRLLEKLGPSYGLYIQLLGRWFRGLITKEEFDRSAKQLIPESFVVEHNKFWLAFFHHCANSEAPSSAANTLAALAAGGHNHFQMNGAIGGDRYRQSFSGQHNTQHSSPGSKSPNHQHSPTNGPTNPSSANSNTTTCSSSGAAPGAAFRFHPHSSSASNPFINQETKVRCLPNKVMSHMKTYVIAWETGLDSAHDHVSVYINLALQHFLKNIITELICTKTAYRLRENRFKYAIGVKPINPYLNNSLKIYTSNLEYDPYQIESNKMNSSLVDTYAYNDSLFPSRLYEAQALYEYACSTTSSSIKLQHSPTGSSLKRMRFSEVLERLEQPPASHNNNTSNKLKANHHHQHTPVPLSNGIHEHNYVATNNTSPNDAINTNHHHHPHPQNHHNDNHIHKPQPTPEDESNCFKTSDDLINDGSDKSSSNEHEAADSNCSTNAGERRLTLYHLLIAFLTNRTIIPSRSLYSINLERILTKLSN